MGVDAGSRVASFPMCIAEPISPTLMAFDVATVLKAGPPVPSFLFPPFPLLHFRTGQFDDEFVG